MTGLSDLLHRIIQVWQENHSDILRSAEEIAAALHQEQEPSHEHIPDISYLTAGYEELVLKFDAEYGGFGSAPKFPTPHTLLFLLRFWKRTGNNRALAMVEKTLHAMRGGGIYDQIGGGFHRYSTDAQWLVPHFEKMLYDQALLVIAYTEAYQATRNPDFKKTAEDIISYVFFSLMSPEGAFFSAEDADSPGGEGAFYLWTPEEIEKILGKEDSIVASRVFGITPTGNYQETGSGTTQNILTCKKSTVQKQQHPLGWPKPMLKSDSHPSGPGSLQHENQRPHPSLDDKILTDWNGLFIAALALAARAFSNEDYLSLQDGQRSLS